MLVLDKVRLLTLIQMFPCFEWSPIKLAKVDVGNVSKKGKNMKGIITWSVFARWFLTELCICMLLIDTSGYAWA